MALNITVELLPKYPAQIAPGTAIDIKKSAGIVTVSFDPSLLSVDPAPNLDNFLVVGVLGDGTPITTGALTAATGASKIQRFATYVEAKGASLFAATGIVEVLGYSKPGDGGAAEFTVSSTEPSHGGKLSFAGGKWGEIVNPVIKTRMLGAVADGSTDDTAAINAALSIGRPIDGDWLTHAVSGNITLPANTDISRAGFKQLTPNNVSRCTLYSNGVANIRLVDVWVDRNGDGAGGSIGSAAGIWIAGSSGHYLERVEVFGSDMGSGIVFTGSSNFKLINPYVHDITYNLTTDPGDDRVQGIYLNNGCSNFTVIAPRAEDLGGTVGGGAFDTKYSRGIAIDGAGNSFTILGGSVKRCDQGVDITGSGGCYDFRVIGMMAEDCQYWGFKVANYNRYGTFIACHSIRAGSGGFVISGGAGSESRGITYIGCRARDTGYRTTARGAAQPAGFWVSGGPPETPDFPRGVKFIGCEAVDDQATKTQVFGFMNETVYGGLQPNEVINCTVSGYAAGGAWFNGFPSQSVVVKQNPGASISNTTWTAIDFNSEVIDSMGMHLSGSPTLITIATPGYYKIDAQAAFDVNATGARFARIVVNGSAVFSTAVSSPGSSASATTLRLSHFGYFESGATISVEVYQNSGGALSLRAEETNLAIYRAMANG